MHVHHAAPEPARRRSRRVERAFAVEPSSPWTAPSRPVPGRESPPVGRPDDEFTLANERTFLSWIRTALALLAGGVLLEQFAARLQPRPVVVGLAVVLALLSATMCGLAYLRWRSHEVAVREGRPLSGSLALPLTAAVMVAVAATIAAMIALQWLPG